jgi:uncharacterized membrane protein
LTSTVVGGIGITFGTTASMATSTDPTLQNLRAVAELERQAVDHRTRMERFTDIVTRAAGRPGFIVAHAMWFGLWIVANRTPAAFDGYPFSLLNMLVSLEAIFLTSFVLMTQNRMTKQADKRAHLDLQVNLLAEQELTAILHMLHALCQKAGTSVKISDARVEQLLKETDVLQLAVALEHELTDSH